MNHATPTLSLVADPAPCMTRDPELWFSEYREDVARAKAVCARCPVQAECLAGAIRRREPLGVWGGIRFAEGEPLDRAPAKVRETVRAARDRRRAESASAEHKRQRRRERRAAERLDPVAVERAVQAVAARLPITGEVGALTGAERREVIRRVFPRYGLSAAQLGELLGVSGRTVQRAAGTATRIRAAAESAAA